MSQSSRHLPLRTVSLDAQFEQQSQQCGIGVAKLKVVYFRGVREFVNSDMTLGSAMIWGLARVQRFINAVTSEQAPELDGDLIGSHVNAMSDPGIELSSDHGSFLTDILYASGEETAELFRPGIVSSMQIEEQLLTVEGTLDGREWVYALDTVSGQHTLHMQ